MQYLLPTQSNLYIASSASVGCADYSYIDILVMWSTVRKRARAYQIGETKLTETNGLASLERPRHIPKIGGWNVALDSGEGPGFIVVSVRRHDSGNGSHTHTNPNNEILNIVYRGEGVEGGAARVEAPGLLSLL